MVRHRHPPRSIETLAAPTSSAPARHVGRKQRVEG